MTTVYLLFDIFTIIFAVWVIFTVLATTLVVTWLIGEVWEELSNEA